MKRIFAFGLITVIALSVFVSCNVSGSDTNGTTEANSTESYVKDVDPAEICGNYARQNDNEIKDYFAITLNADGTYTYYATLFSSYIGIGDYTVEGNIITLVDNNIPTMSGPTTCIFKFEYRHGKLIYLAAQSDTFMYIDLPDGAEFSPAQAK